MSHTATFTGGPEISRITQLAIAEAGLRASERKAGPWMILLATLLVLTAAVAVLVVAMGHGDGRAVAPAPAAMTVPGAGSLQEAISPSEARRIRSLLLAEEDEEEIPLVPIQPYPVRRPGRTDRERELLEVYEDLSRDKREVRPRMPAGLQSPAGGQGPIPEVAMTGPTIPAKLEASPVSPRTTAGSRPGDLQVRRTIRKNFRGIERCHQRQLKRDPDTAGRVLVTAVVAPSGKVTHVEVTTSRAKGSFLEGCLVREVRGWRFPATRGPAREISFPLLLLSR
jgi:hypothetical protein